MHEFISLYVFRCCEFLGRLYNLRVLLLLYRLCGFINTPLNTPSTHSMYLSICQTGDSRCSSLSLLWNTAGFCMYTYDCHVYVFAIIDHSFICSSVSPSVRCCHKLNRLCITRCKPALLTVFSYISGRSNGGLSFHFPQRLHSDFTENVIVMVIEIENQHIENQHNIRIQP